IGWSMSTCHRAAPAATPPSSIASGAISARIGALRRRVRRSAMSTPLSPQSASCRMLQFLSDTSRRPRLLEPQLQHGPPTTCSGPGETGSWVDDPRLPHPLEHREVRDGTRVEVAAAQVNPPFGGEALRPDRLAGPVAHGLHRLAREAAVPHDELGDEEMGDAEVGG